MTVEDLRLEVGMFIGLGVGTYIIPIATKLLVV